MKRNQVLILLFLLCILLLVCLSFFTLANSIDFSKLPTPLPTNPPTPTQVLAPTALKHNRAGAIVQCRYFIKDRLKAPSTAKFSSIETYAIEGKPKNYHAVTGLVEAQNSYGVPLLSYFRCDLHYIPEKSGEWVLDNLEFEQ